MGTRAAAVPGRRNYARRSRIVNPGYQLRAQLPLLVFAALYAGLLVGVLFFPLQRSVAAEPDLGVRAILAAQVSHIHFHLWPLLGVALLLAGYLGWRQSFRVAGPLYRLHRTMSEIAEGDYKTVQFRDGDEFRVFEEDIAQLSAKMKLVASRNRDALMYVHDRVKKLADRVAADEVIPRVELEEAFQSMRTQLEKAAGLGPAPRR